MFFARLQRDLDVTTSVHWHNAQNTCGLRCFASNIASLSVMSLLSATDSNTDGRRVRKVWHMLFVSEIVRVKPRLRIAIPKYVNAVILVSTLAIEEVQDCETRSSSEPKTNQDCSSLISRPLSQFGATDIGHLWHFCFSYVCTQPG